MAAIDKIYVTKPQFEILQRWFDATTELRKKAKIDLPFNQYNLHEGDWADGETNPVWNLSEEHDMWLLSNCPFAFVTDEIKKNYGFDTGGI